MMTRSVLSFTMEHHITCPKCGTIAATVITPVTGEPAEANLPQPGWISEFVSDRCVLRPGFQTSAGILFAAYASWCEDTGAEPLSLKQFGMDIVRFPGVLRHRTSRGRFYNGVALRD